MAILLYRIGAFAAKRRFLVVVVWLLVVVAAMVGAKIFDGQMSQSVEIPGTQSQTAIDMLQSRFPQASGASAKVIFVAPEGADIRSFEAPIESAVDKLSRLEHVVAVTNPFAAGNGSQVASDNSMAFASVQYDVAQTSLTQVDESAIQAAGNSARQSGLTTAYAGVTPPPTAADNSQEAVGLLLALIITAITLGSLLAAGMPLITAAIGVLISISAITIFADFVTISSTAPVLASMLGLAVGIDYALFIVSRHRSQLAAGVSPAESVAVATATAGSAVVFAGLTVIIALVGLSVVGIPFLSVMGFGAAVGVLIAILVSLTLLPAILGIIGRKLIPKPMSRAAKREAELREPAGRKPSMGRRWVTFVTRRPLITLIATVLGLVVVALPALSLRLTIPDAGYDAAGTQARVAYDLLAKGFGPGFNGPLLVTADISKTMDIPGALNALEKQFANVDDVAAVSQAVPNQGLDMAIISLTPASSPDSDATTALVRTIRAEMPAFEKAHGFGYMVTGTTAVAIDISDRLMDALIPFALVVVGLCIVVLAMVFRSIAVPVTATIGFLLSVSATLGVITAVFNWGWLAAPLSVEKVGPVISFMPILLMAVLFGLAMDYQVFLVSRMREDFAKTAAAKPSVIDGFSASARVVTAAALIMFSVFASFVPGGGAVLQPLAGALAIGVLIDAFVVRMTFIPAIMALLGARAWWFPRWLQRIVPDIDLEGERVHDLIAARAWRPERSVIDDFPDQVGEDDTSPVVERTVADELPTGIAAGGLIVCGSAPLDVEVPPGGTLIVTDVSLNRAVLAAITGRLAPTAGRLTVLGNVLPFESARLQRRSVLVHRAQADDAGITIGEYLVSQVRLTARFTQRRAQLRLTAQYLRRFESLTRAADSAQLIDEATGLRELSTLARWCLDVALALASGRPLIAIDMVGLDGALVPELINEVGNVAGHDVTLAFATDAPALLFESALSESALSESALFESALSDSTPPESTPDGRIVVCIAARAPGRERTVADPAEQEALV
ncbi:MMPL family transporter [Rathayibacter soli]|uniref:MMPL family transporter n=1 Tax=Rathayibacter soli TaxID=3144168 RepID=UPI0027E4F4E9|nr:MMPL family transporter [Glaciibacter superstes]